MYCIVTVHNFSSASDIHSNYGIYRGLGYFVFWYSADEEEVVPQKLKKSAKQTETKTSKEVVHVKER